MNRKSLEYMRNRIRKIERTFGINECFKPTEIDPHYYKHEFDNLPSAQEDPTDLNDNDDDRH